MTNKPFAILLKCMDFRLQAYSRDLKELLNLRGFDLLSYPGIARSMVNDPQVYEAMKKAILLSMEVHGTDMVILSGHGDCAAYRIPDHDAEIKAQLVNMRKLREKLTQELPEIAFRLIYFVVDREGGIEEIRVIE